MLPGLRKAGSDCPGKQSAAGTESMKGVLVDFNILIAGVPKTISARNKTRHIQQEPYALIHTNCIPYRTSAFNCMAGLSPDN